MNIESFHKFCLSRKGATGEFPFGEEVLVFKVGGKMFALAGVDLFDSVTMKCDPETGAELRERYAAVQPGYHLNKKHWITVAMDGSIGDELLRTWIDASYQLVVNGLSKSNKLAISTL